jgi:hypothetical protein
MHWALVGAAAARLYIPERVMSHLAIMIARESGAQARSCLDRAGWGYVGELTFGGSSWLTPESFRVDIIESDDPWAHRAIELAQSNLDSHGAPALPLHYLVLMKYKAGRAHDVSDVTHILGLASVDQLAAARCLFDKWAPSDREDLDSLIELGQLEYGKKHPARKSDKTV